MLTRPFIPKLALAGVLALLGLAGAQEAGPELRAPAASPDLGARLRTYFSDQERLVQAAAAAERIELPRDVAEFFEAGRQGDWTTAAMLHGVLQVRLRPRGQPTAEESQRRLVSAITLEVGGALDQFLQGDEAFLLAFTRAVAGAIPRGSVLFAGTDTARYLLPVYVGAPARGEPFITLASNRLAEGEYLNYVIPLFDDQLDLPEPGDVQRAFRRYVREAQARFRAGQLRPGETVTEENGAVQVAGDVALPEVNALLTRLVFDLNPERQFYVEEGTPIEWMYPHLAPHGLVLRLYRRPPRELTEAMVTRDRDEWTALADPLLGTWLRPTTSLADVCAFAERVFGRKDLRGFGGNAAFARSDTAGRMFARLRTAIAGVYGWRRARARAAPERERMAGAADFAFRQALALGPTEVPTVTRYAAFLREVGRGPDARTVVELGLKFDPRNEALHTLAEALKRGD